MTRPFAGFPGDTFTEFANCKMKAMAILRRSSDRGGGCRKKGQRKLALEAGMPLASFNWAVNALEQDGALSIIRHGGRRPHSYQIKPEHLWGHTIKNQRLSGRRVQPIGQRQSKKPTAGVLS